MKKLGAEVLRVKEPTQEEVDRIQRNDIYIVLDNVLDTYNIGAIFRLADAIAAKEIVICGQSETPPNSRIQKASVGTWRWVPWSYEKDVVSALKNLKSRVENLTACAVELTDESMAYDEYTYNLPIALVVGHESDGVSDEALSVCDAAVQLPQLGINKSLNVMVSLGIVLYEVLEKNNMK